MSRRPPANDDTEQSFLKRWSRRKGGSGQAGDTQQPAPGDEAAPTPVGEAGAADPATEEAERVKTDEDMPDLDSITDTTDMRDFFSPGVSEKLRNQALRRLFRMSKFNVVDPLDDYNEDFRSFALLGDLVTSDMRHRLDMDEQRRREAGESEDSNPDGEPTADEPVEDTNQEPERTAAKAGRQDDPGEANPDAADNDSDSPSRDRT